MNIEINLLFKINYIDDNNECASLSTTSTNNNSNTDNNRKIKLIESVYFEIYLFKSKQ